LPDGCMETDAQANNSFLSVISLPHLLSIDSQKLRLHLLYI
jgi:hypothetical protein